MYVFVLVTHKKVYTREKQMNYQKFFPPSYNEFSQLTIASEQQNNTKSDHRMPQNATERHCALETPSSYIFNTATQFLLWGNNPGAKKNGAY